MAGEGPDGQPNEDDSDATISVSEEDEKRPKTPLKAKGMLDLEP